RLHSASDQPHPTAADLRRFMDQPEERGLPPEIQNLLILVYADQTNRSFVRYGGNYTPDLDDLPGELELQEQTLPDAKDWEEAVRALLTSCEGTEPAALVGVVAHVKLDTSGTAMGKSLKSAGAVLACLRATKWDLFSAVAQLTDHRKTEADLLLEDVRSWLKA